MGGLSTLHQVLTSRGNILRSFYVLLVMKQHPALETPMADPQLGGCGIQQDVNIHLSEPKLKLFMTPISYLWLGLSARLRRDQ